MQKMESINKHKWVCRLCGTNRRVFTADSTRCSRCGFIGFLVIKGSTSKLPLSLAKKVAKYANAGYKKVIKEIFNRKLTNKPGMIELMSFTGGKYVSSTFEESGSELSTWLTPFKHNNTILVRVSSEVKTRLSAKAYKENSTVSEVIRKLLTDYVSDELAFGYEVEEI